MMKMNKIFYDTSALLNCNLSSLKDQIVISNITFNELENIKTAYNKDGEIKYRARQVLNYLNDHEDIYITHVFKPSMLKAFDEDIEITNDIKILACANDFNQNVAAIDFLTEDLALKHIAQVVFPKENLLSANTPSEEYTGFKEVVPTEEQLSLFYQDLKQNIFDCLRNQYLILKNNNGEIIDIKCWTGEEYRYLKYKDFTSKQLGMISPFESDVYQKLCFDCLSNNQVSLIRGAAGTGKSLIALGYLFNQLEHGKIDKIIIFCNTVATANSAKLGFLPGDREQKLLDSQIGNFLISKLGGKDAITQLMDQEKLLLLPMSDIRGFDTTGMNAGIYITEGQNMDIPLLKLALQRIGKDSICIIDGDDKSQVDMPQYAGNNNGIRRMSQVFKGHQFYGEVTLQNIYRSEIARVAEAM